MLNKDTYIPYGKQQITEEDLNCVINIMKGSHLTQGEEVPKFEQYISSLTQAKYGIAVNSATSALHLSCLAIGLQEGDYLWTTPNTFVASANCGIYCGAKIDFVDISEDDGLIDLNCLEKKLEQANLEGKIPKILVVVHLAGTSCAMAEIKKITEKYSIAIIEDASHAIGGQYNNEPVGNCKYSDICVFSFHPVKIITTAEGGMVTTNSRRLADKIRKLRTHGITKDPGEFIREDNYPWSYEQHEIGYNYRMTDIQAALGNSQASRLGEIVIERNRQLNSYKVLIKDKNLPISLLKIPDNVISAVHLAVVQLDEYNPNRHLNLFNFMRSNGIGVQVHYSPVHLQPFYRKMGFREGDFPKAEKYENNAFSIPLFPGLTEEQQLRVIDVLHQGLK